MNKAKFRARITIPPDDDVANVVVETWDDELTNIEHSKKGGIPVRDWVLEHFQNTYSGRDDYLELFHLPKDGGYEVVTEGTIHGYWSGPLGEQEYEEEIDILRDVSQRLPDDYFDDDREIVLNQIDPTTYLEAPEDWRL